MEDPAIDTRAMQKGSAEMLVLALLDDRSRHGYELARLIDDRSQGTLQLHAASLYPLLYRLERRGWIEGRWVEKAGQRRRRYYKVKPEGRRILAAQRRTWRAFFLALDRIVDLNHA